MRKVQLPMRTDGALHTTRRSGQLHLHNIRILRVFLHGFYSCDLRQRKVGRSKQRIPPAVLDPGLAHHLTPLNVSTRQSHPHTQGNQKHSLMEIHATKKRIPASREDFLHWKQRRSIAVQNKIRNQLQKQRKKVSGQKSKQMNTSCSLYVAYGRDDLCALGIIF